MLRKCISEAACKEGPQTTGKALDTKPDPQSLLCHLLFVWPPGMSPTLWTVLIVRWGAGPGDDGDPPDQCPGAQGREAASGHGHWSDVGQLSSECQAPTAQPARPL